MPRAGRLQTIALTALPTEIINAVVAVLCRLGFDFALAEPGVRRP
jgi:hypothetical protein